MLHFYPLVTWAWWDWPFTRLYDYHCSSVLWHCCLGHLVHEFVSEMTYNVSSGALNRTIPYSVDSEIDRNLWTMFCIALAVSIIASSLSSVITGIKSRSYTCKNKKLSCCRETARCFVSLNISLRHSWSLKTVPFESLDKVSYLHSIVTIAISCIVSEIWRDNGRKSIAIFHTVHAFDALIRGSLSEYCHNVRYGKTRMMWLLGGEKKFDDALSSSTKYRRVTDI